MAGYNLGSVTPIAINHKSSETTFDIVAVPAIGADPATTWSFSEGRERASGLVGSSIFDELPSARVYFYQHPPLHPRYQHDIGYYARRLREYLLRLPELGGRPISLVGHSTGGIVIKSALTAVSLESDENESCWELIRRCFSVSFFGVPHRGSTILSDDVHQESVAAILSLNSPMSSFLRQAFRPDHREELEKSSRDFVSVSNRLKKIWSFVEGQETTVYLKSDNSNHSQNTPLKQKGRTTTFFKTPIVDRRSATLATSELEFGVEEVIEIDARHARLSNFDNSPESDIFKRYLQELRKLALGLSGDEAKDLEILSNLIKADVHLFYEGTHKGNRTYVKLWSEFPTLLELCEQGPTRCLESRFRISRLASLPNQPEPKTAGESLAVPQRDWTVSVPRLTELKPQSPLSRDVNAIPDIVIEDFDVSKADDGEIGTANGFGNNEASTIPEQFVQFNTSPSKLFGDSPDPFHAHERGLQSENASVAPNSRSSDTDVNVSLPKGDRFSNPISAEPQDLDATAELDVVPEQLHASFHRSSTSLQSAKDRRKSLSNAKSEIEDAPMKSPKRADTLDLVFPEFLHKKRKKWGSLSEAARKIANSGSSRQTTVPPPIEDDTGLVDLERHNPDAPQSLIQQEMINKSVADATMPSKDRIKFRWMHVPANNMIWVPAVLKALATELKQPYLQRALLHRQVWNTLQHIPRHKSPHGRFMTPSCNGIFPETGPKLRSMLPYQSPTGDIQMSLFFPYLHWDTYIDLQKRSRLADKRIKKGHIYPAEKGIRHDCAEHQLIWWYLSNASDLPMHIRRSLDQYGYPNLSNTKARDMDQILYKRTRSENRLELVGNPNTELEDKERLKSGRRQRWKDTVGKSDDQDDPNSCVLMVDTLWLLVPDSTSVITFFPSRKQGQSYMQNPSDPRYRAADIRDMIYNDVNGDPQFARQCHDCFDFAALSILHATTALLEGTDELDLQVFRIFEEYLSDLTELQTKSFKEFRDSQLTSDGPEDEQSIRHMLGNLHNREDLTALLELRDISDELKTLDKLFTEQIKVIDQMLNVYKKINCNLYQEDLSRSREHLPRKHDQPELRDHKQHDTRIKSPEDYPHHGQYQSVIWLNDAKASIKRYSEQSQDMQKRCESVQEAYKLLLDMKQKQANVAEASLSRLSAQVASEQNRAIMIFTIFTIIFLPLSFFTSLFGMNARQWSGVDSNPSFHEIFLVGGIVSVSIIIVALLLAFNRPIRHKVVKFFRRSLKYWPIRLLMITWQKTLGQCFSDPKRQTEIKRGRLGDVEANEERSRRLSAFSAMSHSNPEKIAAYKLSKSNLD